jgi:hypothetical protein
MGVMGGKNRGRCVGRRSVKFNIKGKERRRRGKIMIVGGGWV